MYINNNISNIKQQLRENTYVIETFEDIDILLCQLNSNNIPNRTYIIFKGSELKQHFLNTQTMFNIINCNSSIDRFKKDMEGYDSISTIFNNINTCKDEYILNIVNQTNNILLH